LIKAPWKNVGTKCRFPTSFLFFILNTRQAPIVRYYGCRSSMCH
jgi:hypothetical protein